MFTRNKDKLKEHINNCLSLNANLETLGAMMLVFRSKQDSFSKSDAQKLGINQTHIESMKRLGAITVEEEMRKEGSTSAILRVAAESHSARTRTRGSGNEKVSVHDTSLPSCLKSIWETCGKPGWSLSESMIDIVSDAPAEGVPSLQEVFESNPELFIAFTKHVFEWMHGKKMNVTPKTLLSTMNKRDYKYIGLNDFSKTFKPKVDLNAAQVDVVSLSDGMEE